MFSIRATRRSGDGIDDRRSQRVSRVTLLAHDYDERLEPLHYYADLGFHPPAS
jgi:hypothetical protein